jgi:hypothetical protein
MPHSRGDALSLKADIQNQLEAFALSQLVGANNPEVWNKFVRPEIVRGFNGCNCLQPLGSLVTLGPLVLDPNRHVQAKREPSVRMTKPKWSNAFGRCAIALAPIGSHKAGDIAVGGYAHAKVFIVNPLDQFAAPDPEQDGRLRSSDTGEFKIVADISDVEAGEERICLVRFGHSDTVLWRYDRMTSERPEGYSYACAYAPETSSDGSLVRLLRLDGEQFGPNANVILEGETAADEGYMMQVGSKFWPLIGSTGADIVLFEFVEEYPGRPVDYYDDDNFENCEDRIAPEELRGRVLKVSCGRARPVPGEDADGIIDLIDDTGKLTGRDYRDLPGRLGFAVRMKDGESGNPYDSCYWSILEVNFLRWRQVVSDQIWESKRIRTEREMHLVEDHCKLPDEYIEGIDCEDDEDYYQVDAQITGGP